MWAGTTDGLYLSDNAGKTWRGPLLQGNTIAVIVRDAEGKFYLGTKYHGVFTTDASVQTFTPFAKGLEQSTINALVINPTDGVIYAGTEGGLYCALIDPLKFMGEAYQIYC